MIDEILVRKELQRYLFFVYIIFSLLLFLYSLNFSGDIQLFYIQFVSVVVFVVFFLLGGRYSPDAFLLFVLIYQLSLSVMWSEYFFCHQHLLDNNGDWKTYVRWASYAPLADDFIDYIKITRKSVYEIADMGYPIFLYPYYRFFSTFEVSYFASVVGKAIFYSIGTLYVYKIALRFLSKGTAKLVFLLWALNPAAIFFNGVNLKENVFVTICVFAVYNMVVFKKSKKIPYLFGFLFFTFLTIFFRIFVTFFIFASFLAITVFRKFVNRHFLFIWFSAALLGFVAIRLLMKVIPALVYFVGQSLGGDSGISMPVLILTAFMSPIPAFRQLRTTPDNFLVCAYSIFTVVLSFYALYEIFLIFKQKKENLYGLLFLTFFNKLLVIISARSNEYRFQYPLVFSYIILMICGFRDAVTDGVCIFGKRHFSNQIFGILALCFVLGLTYMYNGAF